jgi:hypothetical protein
MHVCMRVMFCGGVQYDCDIVGILIDLHAGAVSVYLDGHPAAPTKPHGHATANQPTSIKTPIAVTPMREPPVLFLVTFRILTSRAALVRFQ